MHGSINKAGQQPIGQDSCSPIMQKLQLLLLMDAAAQHGTMHAHDQAQGHFGGEWCWRESTFEHD